MKLEQLTTAEAIQRIENRIDRLRKAYYGSIPGPSAFDFTEAILLSLCDVLRGGFTR